MQKFDIVIVGAGIAGLTAAIYLKYANANFVVLEGKKVGGKLNDLKAVENYPAIPKTTGTEILARLQDQLVDLNIKPVITNIQTILKQPEGFEVKTDLDSYVCKAVIVGTGIYEKGNLIKGEKEAFGQGVSYCAVCDGNFFKGQDVAVIGNNNIAIEEVEYLANIVRKLYLVVPAKELNGKISKHDNVEVILDAEPIEIQSDLMGVNKLILKNKELEVSGVFPYLGSKSSSQILANLKPESEGVYVKTNDSMMTNIPGLFVVGDLRAKRLRQLITAASDGSVAAIAAHWFVKQN